MSLLTGMRWPSQSRSYQCREGQIAAVLWAMSVVPARHPHTLSWPFCHPANRRNATDVRRTVKMSGRAMGQHTSSMTHFLAKARPAMSSKVMGSPRSMISFSMRSTSTGSQPLSLSGSSTCPSSLLPPRLCQQRKTQAYRSGHLHHHHWTTSHVHASRNRKNSLLPVVRRGPLCWPLEGSVRHGTRSARSPSDPLSPPPSIPL